MGPRLTDGDGLTALFDVTLEQLASAKTSGDAQMAIFELQLITKFGNPSLPQSEGHFPIGLGIFQMEPHSGTRTAFE
jgi:hypothetical protein